VKVDGQVLPAIVLTMKLIHLSCCISGEDDSWFAIFEADFPLAEAIMLSVLGAAVLSGTRKKCTKIDCFFSCYLWYCSFIKTKRQTDSSVTQSDTSLHSISAVN
jgi:hypothetical protein